jgi:transposase
MSEPRRTYSAEFKREAVALVVQQGLSFVEAARRLGIRDSLLRKWKAALEAQGDQAFPGKGQQNAQEAELARLRRENEQLRMERDILKKATAFFARESK